MSADSPAVEDDYEAQDIRDRRLLGRIADARARGDELGSLRERTAMGELLAPYWFKVRRIVGWRLASISPDPTDVEDISSKVIEHMIKKLKKTTDLGGAPFRVVVFLDAHTRAIDYWRARTRRNSRLSDFGGELPEIPAREEVALVHAEVMAEIIGDLAPRDQRFLVERYVAGLTPQEIADGLGVSREVVDTAYSRALAKLRVHPRVIAVRDRMREAV
jgi:RNA polymerase sigma factor (sigma-70 family)